MIDTRKDPTHLHTQPSARRWWILVVMSLGALVVFIDNTVVNTALPTISRSLGASTAQLQWVVDAYALVIVGLSLLGGSMGDRFGRRRAMTIGLAVFAIGALVAADAGSAMVLIGGRAIQGLGAALILPATLSIITNVFPRNEQAVAIGVWAGVGGLGFGFGPLIGGYLVTRLDWPAIFWLHLPIILVVLVGMAIVPRSRDARRRYLDIRGSVLVSAGLMSLVFGIIRVGEHGLGDLTSLTAFAVAALALVRFVRNQQSAAEPILPLWLFKQRDFTGAILLISITVFAFFATLFFLTQYIQVVLGRTALEAGALMLPMALATLVTAPLGGSLVRKVGPRRLLVAMSLLMAVGTLLLVGLDADSSTVSLLPALIAFGLGFGLGEAPLTDTVMAAVPPQDAGVGSAINDVSRELGGALGIAVIGSMVNTAYRGNLLDSMPPAVPHDVQEAALDGVAVAGSVAEGLPPSLGHQLVEASREAFVSAIGSGFRLSGAILLASAVIAVTMIPKLSRVGHTTEEA